MLWQSNADGLKRQTRLKSSGNIFLGGRPLSEVCDKYSIAPTQFYQWQKTFFENGTAAFAPKKPGREYDLENKVKQLNKKLARKDEVIAELVEHNIDLKKKHGQD